MLHMCRNSPLVLVLSCFEVFNKLRGCPSETFSALNLTCQDSTVLLATRDVCGLGLSFCGANDVR